MGFQDGSKKRREFDCIKKLHGSASVFYYVPKSIVFDRALGKERVTVFSYFALSCGRWNRVGYCLNDIVEWTKRKPKQHQGNINSRMSDCIERLGDKGFLYDVGNIAHASYSHAFFDSKKVSDECGSERYAVLYLDEAEKIFERIGCGANGSRTNVDAVLLVFAYLRMMICRRQNELFVEEYDVEYRRRQYPEVYSSHCADIADDIGISVRAASKAVEILEDIGLIHTETTARVKREGRWVRPHMLICNAYKREGDELVAEGSGYYDVEVANKIEMLKSMGR